jgi:hypothetical protein
MVLRHLAVGFGVHRLYPGDVNADAFIAAVDRIRTAANEALQRGPVAIEIRSGRFEIGGEVIADEATRRLAQACYERRIEHIVLEQVPDREELGRWYQLLSRDPNEIEEAGGMESQLAAAGVRSIRSASGRPDIESGDEVPDELSELADWMAEMSGEPTTEEVDDLGLQPGETAETLYDRLSGLSDRITRDGKVRSTFFRRAAWLVDELPAEEQASFGRLVIDRLADDAFAERYVGHLNDLALATLLVVVGRHEGRDARELAAHVSDVADRHATLLTLVTAVNEELDVVAVPDPSGAILLEADLDIDYGAVSPTPLTDGVAVAVGEDRELAAGFPADDVEGRRLALTALIDVMLAHPRAEHAEAILANVLGHLRAAVVEGDVRAVADLLDTLDRAEDVARPDVVAQIQRSRAQALNGQVVAEAATGLSREGRRLDAEVLRPFGHRAILPLVVAAGSDVADPIARNLCDLLLELSADHRTTLYDELARQRPDVIAKLVPVVSRDGDHAMLPWLSRMATRTEPRLLSVVVDALAMQAGRDAAPVVASMARRTDDPQLQRRCLAVLAGFGAPGRASLLELAADREAPRLPWTKRRAARRLARRIGGA